MAQLPPKVPTMPQDFSNFHHQQRLHSMSNFTQSSTQQQQSWVDDFLNFSTSKRNAHRRSARDSITFLEAPMIEEESPASSAVLRSRDSEFERLDDEQLMSMFTDDISPKNVTSSPIPSTSSEHNEEKPTFSDQQPKSEPTEVESSCVLETSAPAPSTTTSDYQAIDPKRVRRILANRQSAQRSRVRKLQYISELERSVNSLQNEVSTLSPRVAFLDHQRLVLNVDNSALKQRLAALAQDNIFKDAHQEALRKEIERLRQVYHEQNLKKMGDTGNDTEVCTENEELVD